MTTMNLSLIPHVFFNNRINLLKAKKKAYEQRYLLYYFAAYFCYITSECFAV